METETTDIKFLRRVAGKILTDEVGNHKSQNELQSFSMRRRKSQTGKKELARTERI